MKCQRLGPRHWYVTLSDFNLLSIHHILMKGVGTPNFEKLLPLFLELP